LSRVLSLWRWNREQKTTAAIIACFIVYYLVLGWVIDQRRVLLTYYVSQWMITWGAGFIRRGILGQTIWDLSSISHIPPVELIKSFQYLLAVAFSCVLGFQCFKNRAWLGVAGVCLILSNPYLSKYIWLETGSSDLFFVLVSFANLWLTKFEVRRYVKYAFLLMATAGVFVALSHEAFILLSLPLNLLITWRRLDSDRALTSAKIYALPVLACMVQAGFHGTPAQATFIEHSWRALGLNVPKGTSIHYLGFSIAKELGFVRAVLSFKTVIVWILATVLCAIPLIWFSEDLLRSVTQAQRSAFRRRFWDFLGVPLFCTLPMYVIGSDWDRWPAIPIIGGVVCLLTVANKEFGLSNVSIKKSHWILLCLLGMMVRPVTPNVTIGAVFTGPLDITCKILFNRRI
jgi:hypothetical protein